MFQDKTLMDGQVWGHKPGFLSRQRFMAWCLICATFWTTVVSLLFSKTNILNTFPRLRDTQLIWAVALFFFCLLLREIRRRIATFLTQRRLVDLETKESQHLHQLLFENMLNGVAYCRMRANSSGEAEFIHLQVNAGYEEFTGLRSSDVIGRPFLDVVPSLNETNPEFVAVCKLIAATGGRERVQILLPQFGRWLEIVVVGIKKDHFAMIFEDITERRDYETEILRLTARIKQRDTDQALRMGATLQDMEALIYAMSGHMRKLVRNVEDSLLPLSFRCGSKQQCCDPIEQIVQSSQKMTVLLDGTLSYIQASALPLALEFVDVAAIIRQVSDELRDSYKKVEFRLHALPKLIAAPLLLQVVFYNLLTNASKFSSGRKLPVVEVGSHRTAEETVFYVRDNGVGFDSDRAGDLFSPFSRLHPDTEFPGVGIGLALVKRLVERQGGRVWAETTPGKGSTFFVAMGPLPMEN